MWLGAILIVALAGKWGGAAAAARLSGLPWRQALALGPLMNSRGLTELIVLSVALDLGVIGRDLFTMLVLMALLTTAITSPSVAAFGYGSHPPNGSTGTPGTPTGMPKEVEEPPMPDDTVLSG